MTDSVPIPLQHQRGVALARQLQMNTVVEGVETADHLQTIAMSGCQVQGFYFSKQVQRAKFERSFADVSKFTDAAGAHRRKPRALPVPGWSRRMAYCDFCQTMRSHSRLRRGSGRWSPPCAELLHAALLGNLSFLFDEDAMHDSDLTGRSAKAQERNSYPGPRHLQ
jgi:hypothetical protein